LGEYSAYGRCGGKGKTQERVKSRREEGTTGVQFRKTNVQGERMSHKSARKKRGEVRSRRKKGS